METTVTQSTTKQETPAPLIPTTVNKQSLINRTTMEMSDMVMPQYWSQAAFGVTRVDDLFVVEKLVKIAIRFIILGSIFYMLIAGVAYLRKTFSYGSKYMLKKELQIGRL